MESLARTYKIETERLLIRCFQPSDAYQLHDAILANIDHLRPWVPFAKDEPKDLAYRIALTRTFRGKFDLGQEYVFGIFDRAAGTLLGGTGLHTRPIAKDAREIGYWIGSRHVNRGYANEAVSALIRVGFEIEGLNRLEIRVHPDNIRSRRIPQKLGFHHETTVIEPNTQSRYPPGEAMIWSLSPAAYAASPIRSLPATAYDILDQIIPWP